MVYKSTPYILKRGEEHLVFPSEKSACEYLGVAKCSVASCYRRGVECKGYKVIRGTSEAELYNDKRLRKIWESMHERCEYAKHPHFKDYGGRGISVCDEWSLYLPFAKWAFKNGYSPDLSIERVDHNGDYSPRNCRWATMKEQQNNKRSNRLVSFQGETLTISQWSERIGIEKTTLRERLNSGWSIEDALLKPVRPRGAKMDGGE